MRMLALILRVLHIWQPLLGFPQYTILLLWASDSMNSV